MISVPDLKLVTQAIELLYHGVNIEEVTDFTQYYNPVTKKFQSKSSPNIKPLLINYNNDCMQVLQHYYGPFMVRVGPNSYDAKYESSLSDEDKTLTRIDVTLDMLQQVMMTLINTKKTFFLGIPPSLYDPEYIERINKIRKEWNYTETRYCPMMDSLSNDSVRQNLEIMLTMSEYPLKLCKEVMEHFDSDETDFDIPAFKDFKVIDHRLYIPISPADQHDMSQECEEMHHDLKDTKYIVISRNPYDFFFCSYGSAIQSCFSINSDHYGGYGMYPMASHKGCYLIYGTHGNGVKCNVINGKKWNVPHMYWRYWAWLGDDGQLYLDRPYLANIDSHQYHKTFGKLLSKFIGKEHKYFTNNMAVTLKYGEDYADYFDKYDLKIYPDSVYFSAKKSPVTYRGICYGNREFVGRKVPSTNLLSACRSIVDVSPAFHITDKPFIKNGTLCVMKTCPITQVPIDENQEKSYYAKFYKESLNDLTVITFCDNRFRLLESSVFTKRPTDFGGFLIDSSENGNSFSEVRPKDIILTKAFSLGTTSLPVFKEKIKQLLNTASIHNVLLKVVDDNSVQYIKYRK
jgi:hypothetical protein